MQDPRDAGNVQTLGTGVSTTNRHSHKAGFEPPILSTR